MDSFCGSQFWDWNKTWNTNDPQLTPCFEKTVLSWIPCAFLWISSTVDIYYYCTSNLPKIPLTKLHLCKLVCNIAIIILTLVKFLYEFVYLAASMRLTPVDLYSPIVIMTTLILAVGLLIGDRVNGFYSSGGQFTFWLLLSVSESIALRTLIKSDHSNHFSFVVRIIISSMVYFMFLLNCWSDSCCSSEPAEIGGHTRLHENQDDGIPNPEVKASFLSKLTFTWAGKIVHTGYKRPLQFSDLWELQLKDKTQYLCDSFLKYSKIKINGNPIEKSKKPNIKNEEKTNGMFPTVIKPLFRAFGWQYTLMILLRICADVIWFITPQLLSCLIEFVANEKTEYAWRGYFYATLLFLAAMLRSFLLNSHVNMMWIIAYRIRSALNCAIYRKSLKISNFARKGTTVGEIVNLMSVDADRVLLFSCWLFQLVASPIQIGIAMYFLYDLLGFAIVSGVAIMVLLIPINFFVSRKMQTLQRAQMERKDDRVKLMNEILSGIKIIKLYAWEPSFMDQVGKIRDSEISLLKKKAYLQAANAFAWKSAPFLVSLTSFSTYILLSDTNILDAQKAFVSLSLFNLLNEPLYNLASVVSRGVECVVSVKRISNFMNFAEKDNDAVTHNENVQEAIKIENGNFAWDDDKLTLQNINLKIKEGSLVAIVGNVGSGKTSILEALLGELRKISGTVNIRGKLAYVPQQAWIQNATLERNITFGLPFENSKYENIINCCALRPDLDILPGRDQTEIGEKGINLSGGQKQRVALARAAYFNADVYLLDDPLSAVDSHVGKHIFENLIGRGGLLNRKTRILVTNAVSFLPYVDHIIVLNDGKISECGVYSELLERKGAFSDFLVHYAGKNEQPSVESKECFHISLAEAEKERLESEAEAARQKDENANKGAHTGVENKLIKEEKPQTGNIKGIVIKNYLKSIGWRVTCMAIVSYTLYQSFAVSCNLWLSESSKDKTGSTGNATQDMAERDLFLSVYGVLGLFQCVFIFAAVCLLFLGTLDAAKKLHNNMLVRIFRAPMSFFDTTPLGRIVNRFSADVQAIDQDLPGTISDFLGCFFQILAILFVISFSTPVFLGVILAIAPIYIFMQRYFAASSRQLFRLESVTRSPIFSHFSETLNGVTSIRAYAAQERFLQESETRIDNLQKTLVPLIVSRRWLGIRLQTLGNVVILCSAIFSVMARKTMSPSLVGLSISYALQMSQNLLSLMIYGTLLETQIVSAERVIEYTEIEQENEWDSKSKTKPNDTWPDTGAISIKSYSTRYRKGMDLVLKNITCDIEPGEKIGIVGRTGAGKSSVTLGLFRIIEAFSGSITIDGHKISQLGLHALRSRLTIIPQDPVLFSGTIRFNLDPFSAYNDDALWRALEHSHLKSFVQQFSAGLDHELLEGGGNLSVGQRQLVCLARAILRKTKILILDEATAAVDLETDDLIQATIRQEFKDCTVITIAHRLNTILDSSRIIVLVQGEIHEFDSPDNLLADHNSLFFDMVRAAGLIS